MAGDKDKHLERIAEAVADRSRVNWEEYSQDGPDVDRRVANLRRIEAVAAAYAAVESDHGPAEDAGDGGAGCSPDHVPLFRWGTLEVLQKLGEGAFGEVFRAYDPALDREVALKLWRSDRAPMRGGQRTLLAEARRLAKVRHPNVVVVHGADSHDGRLGLWTDLVEGRTLHEVLSLEGPLGAREATLIGIDLCAALSAVHAAGVVHGDVKTANVMRERGGRTVLMDFGAGTDYLSSDRRLTSPAFGTPLSLAPEVLEGADPAPASDLYSLGALLFLLVTGRHPVEASTIPELLERHRRGERASLDELRPDLPSRFVAVVEHALAREPAARFNSAAALHRALSDTLGDSGEEPEELRRGEGTTPTVRRRASRPRHIAVLAALVLVSVGAVSWLLLRFGQAPTALEPMGGDARATSSRPIVPPQGRGQPIASAQQPQSSLALEAALFRDVLGEKQALLSGAIVRPGDRLFLEVDAPEPVYIYVLNEDRSGNLFVLFPLPGLELSNPLPPGRRHRLPGPASGVTHDWLVTSAGGEETLLVVASRSRLSELEETLGELTTADTARTVDMRPPAGEERLAMRGVGGLAPAPGVAEGQLGGLVRRLAELPAHEDLWVKEVVLSNPGG